MADADRDRMLRDMAANRGCRLVKSRRRTPGTGDYGRYGLTDAASGREILGFGADGLTATPEEVEAFLRKGLVADWKSSLLADADAPAAADPTPATPRRAPPKPAGKAAPPRPSGKPALRIVGKAAAPPLAVSRRPDPAPAAPPPPRPILKIRDARAADAAGLARLVGGEAGDALAARIALLRKAGAPPLVAEEGGEMLGCIAFHPIPLLDAPEPLGRITFLLVAEHARRRGIGRALVEEAEARLRDLGCTRVEALAEIELAAAPDFYRRLGWSRGFYRYGRPLDA